MQLVANTLHTTSEHGVSNITTADANTSAGQQSTEMTPPGRFKQIRPFRPNDEFWFLRVCHHISTGLYNWWYVKLPLTPSMANLCYCQELILRKFQLSSTLAAPRLRRVFLPCPWTGTEHLVLFHTSEKGYRNTRRPWKLFIDRKLSTSFA